MACFETGTVISLAPREALTLPDIRGATLRVTRGTLWLTEEGGRDDVVLRPGDNWLVESNGDTVVEAQGDVTFCVVGLQHRTLERPSRERPTATLLAALATWLVAPPSHKVPYA